MAAKRASAQSKKRTVMIVLLLFSMTILLRYAALLFALGMLPAFVASYVDASQERYNYRIVFACNLAGVLPFILQLWQSGISAESVQDKLSDTNVWLTMYGAAGAGWVLVWVFPRLVHFIISAVQQGKVNLLKQKQKQILDEWGDDVQTAALKVVASNRKS